MMENQLQEYITALLENDGYNVGEIIIDRLLPSRENETRKKYEIKISIIYEQRDRHK